MMLLVEAPASESARPSIRLTCIELLAAGSAFADGVVNLVLGQGHARAWSRIALGVTWVTLRLIPAKPRDADEPEEMFVEWGVFRRVDQRNVWIVVGTMFAFAAVALFLGGHDAGGTTCLAVASVCAAIAIRARRRAPGPSAKTPG
jgi:hypothetical protein